MTLRALLAAASLLFCQASFGEPNNRYPFSIDTEKSSDGHKIIAHNLGAAPVSVKITLSDTLYISPDRSFPLTVVVPPGDGAFLLGQIRPAISGVSYKFKAQANWQLGDFKATHAPGTIYRLPYRDGSTFRIGQAPGGRIITHTGPDSQYAVDIIMPEGTPVLAARGGTVIQTKSSQTSGGQSSDLLDKANIVRILHSDGTIAVYAHLAHSSIQVSPGQQVETGQQIGLSGSTGYSSGPHLHLAVQALRRNGDKFEIVSLPFNFYVGNPPLVFAPQTGMRAKADYSAPGSLPNIVEPAIPQIVRPLAD